MIKAYTDLSQSKKLVEILPLESADMYYRDWKRMTKYIHIAHVGSADEEDLPCWSLTALLSVLPKLGAEEPSIQKLYYASNPTERYICQYSLTNMTGEYDNPVDACYEMVLLLKEKNLIWKQQN
jgi:hypothetical protein